MVYLDALLGFALVMALLAGSVTALMEGFHRALSARRRNLMMVVARLDDELAAMDGVELTLAQRARILEAIARNPLLEPGAGASSGDEDGAEAHHRLKALKDRWRVPPDFFDRVSTEHVVRRVGEVLAASGLGTSRLRRVLGETAQRFDVLTACVSAEFRRRSQRYSIVAGIVLALLFNLNGHSVLEGFLRDPQLAGTVETRLGRLQDELERIEAPATIARATSVDGPTVQDLYADFEGTVQALTDQGLPLGWGHYPHCLWAERTGSSVCLVEKARYGFVQGAADLLLLLFTGALMGLGAPFWFNVAKRVAEVRQWFHGKPPTEIRKAGRDADDQADCLTLGEQIAEELGAREAPLGGG